jgi:hypothetical protein
MAGHMPFVAERGGWGVCKQRPTFPDYAGGIRRAHSKDEGRGEREEFAPHPTEAARPIKPPLPILFLFEENVIEGFTGFG